LKRLLLLVPTTSYRIADFLAAARRLKVEVVIGSNRRSVLERHAKGRTLALDFRNLERGRRRIVRYARERPLDAIVAVDDAPAILAASASEALGLPHNEIDAVVTTRDKHLFRTRPRKRVDNELVALHVQRDRAGRQRDGVAEGGPAQVAGQARPEPHHRGRDGEPGVQHDEGHLEVGDDHLAEEPDEVHGEPPPVHGEREDRNPAAAGVEPGADAREVAREHGHERGAEHAGADVQRIELAREHEPEPEGDEEDDRRRSELPPRH